MAQLITQARDEALRIMKTIQNWKGAPRGEALRCLLYLSRNATRPLRCGGAG